MYLLIYEWLFPFRYPLGRDSHSLVLHMTNHLQRVNEGVEESVLFGSNWLRLYIPFL